MKRRVPILGMLLGWIILLTSGCTHLGPRFDAYSTNSIVGATHLTAGSVITNQLSESLLKVPSAVFRLGPGDRLDIEVLGDEEGPVATFVGPDGKIYFGLLEGQRVWGLTLAETKALLERKLGTYLRQPQVALTLRGVESQRVWVMGRINTPGIYPIEGPMTLLEAITKAGGLFTSRFSGSTEELADLHHSFIVRRGQYLPVNFHQLIREGDTDQNIYLEPDDFVYLPSSLSTEVFVLGAVVQPRAVSFKDQVTLVSAVATAGGLAPGARAGQIAIIRGSLTTPTIALIDFQDIVTGRVPDIRLQPRDIVYVPISPYATLEKYLQLAVNTFVRTVAANEGGRAVDPNYQGTGTSIPLGP